jgi:hypothetical protein
VIHHTFEAFIAEVYILFFEIVACCVNDKCKNHSMIHVIDAISREAAIQTINHLRYKVAEKCPLCNEYYSLFINEKSFKDDISEDIFLDDE